jgi:hypothetical protein
MRAAPANGGGGPPVWQLAAAAEVRHIHSFASSSSRVRFDLPPVTAAPLSNTRDPGFYSLLQARG